MSLGNKLLSSLVHSPKGGQQMLQMGIRKEYFKGSEEDLYNFVDSHLSKFGVIPAADTLKEHGFELLPATEPPSYYWDKIKDRHMHLLLKKGMLESSELMNSGDVKQAFTILRQAVFDADRTAYGNQLVNYSTDGIVSVIKEFIQKNLHGDNHGMMLGWPTCDKESGGLTGGDVLSIVGRPAMGKTYSMLYTAIHAWNQGITPVFVSMEMKPLAIAQRLAAMDIHIPIKELKKGALTDYMVGKLKSNIATLKGKPPFWILDGSLTATVSDIRMLVKQLDVGAVWIDGAYLLRHPNAKIGRWEKVTDNAEQIKGRLAEDLNVPTVISYQFNRATEKMKKDEKPGLDNIAYTDAIGQLSSIVLGMFEDDSVETLKSRKIEIMKGRDGQNGDYRINWNFSTGPKFMDFSEMKPIEEMQFL